MDEGKNRKLDVYVQFQEHDIRTRFKIAGELMIKMEVGYDTILRRFANRKFREYEIDVVKEIMEKYEN